MNNDELRLRYLLWAQHPCGGKYGDDGEMQCGACGVDFRRDSPASIEAKIVRANTERLAQCRMAFGIDEGQRQTVLLALAELALTRPGWNWMLGEIAEHFQGREMFDNFKAANADRIKPVSLLAPDAILAAELLQPLPSAEDFRVMDAMERDGGGFVNALAEAARRADPSNFQILKNAFPEYWAKYRDMAKQDKEREP